MLYGDIKNTYENVAYVQAMLLVVKIGVVYTNLYYLKIKFFDKGKYFFYASSLGFFILLASVVQIFVIAFCMEMGIYHPAPWSSLFSAKKFFSVMGHINWILIVTFIIKFVKDSYQNIQLNSKILQQKQESEIQFLKSQINPHFFFNTLNNLYSLAIQKSDKTPELILKLSDLMSYMIYDTSAKRVSLTKEIDYLKNYVELEKLRFGEHINVDFTVIGSTKEALIAPLIFVAFIENAFKHGVDKNKKDNNIDIVFDNTGSKLKFSIKNNIPKKSTEKEFGVGLNNVKRRLELLYPDAFQLIIKRVNGTHEVELTLRSE